LAQKVAALLFLLPLAAGPALAKAPLPPAGHPSVEQADAKLKKLREAAAAAAKKFPGADEPLDDERLLDAKSVKKRLLYMREIDQLTRKALIDHWNNRLPGVAGDYYGHHITLIFNGVDAPHTAELKRVLAARKGKWPTISEFGEDGSKAAWLIAQHADADPAFQEKALAAMKRLPEDEIDQKDLCYLTDRVAAKMKTPQECGTQFHCVDGEPRPQGDPDADGIAIMDAARRKLGLEPIAEYAKSFQSYCDKRKND
jgi:hypothetical protein